VFNTRTEERQLPISLFYSYAHSDEDLRVKLEKHLALLKRQNVISTWHDRKIEAGSEWKTQIDVHINHAQIILLLVSPDFIASDYCYDVELKQALERHKKGLAQVIPIILRPVHWQDAPFSQFQALPTDAKPITLWSNEDSAFLSVAQGIRRAVESLTKAAL
jgi:TIR domain-containing protein